MNRSAIAELARILHPFKVRISNLIAKGVVTRSNDGKKLQSLQLGVLAGESVNDCERFQEYGFTSRPPEGAEAVVLFPDGDRSRGLVVATDDRRTRPKDFEAGEAAMYGPTGTLVKMMADGTVRVTDNGTAGPAAARVGDAVEVTFPAGSIMVPNPTGPPDSIPNATDLTFSGVITEGSAILNVR